MREHETENVVAAVRQILTQASGARAANDETTTRHKVRRAQRKVRLSFGLGVLFIAFFPATASILPWIDKSTSALCLLFALVLAIVGGFFIDVANRDRKAFAKEHAQSNLDDLG
jgi:FtsH-binding integral membrane protein